MARFIARWRLGAFGLACALALALAAPAGAAESRAQHLCGSVLPGFAHCDALARQLSSTTARTATNGPPYGPSDLQDAYALADKAATLGSDQTVGIVDAYDDPNAESDLAAYRSGYSLPPCTTSNGCFLKVNETGGSLLPTPNSGWAREIAIDLDMVSAVCPHCHILLVETNSNSLTSLVHGETTASQLGATQISNSWGSPEFSSERFVEPSLALGVPITASSGDGGYGVEYPAASGHVTAVGGTSLEPASNARGWTESAWSGAGSGCSLYIAKPAWQHDPGCAKRTVADVSAVADPDPGVLVYNTYGGGRLWQAGGTSVAAPIVAASYALLGSTVSGPSFPYGDPGRFNDATSGSNGVCSIGYLCHGLVGFDGPTGIGTPNLAGTGDGSTSVTDSSGADPFVPPPPPTQQPVTTVQAPPQPAKPLLSSVAVGRSVVRTSRSGRVRVRIACGSGPTCSGALGLQARLHGAALRALGSARYTVRSGSRATISVRLSRSTMRWLKLRHSLRVYGTARDKDGTAAQASFLLRAPKRRK